MSVFLTGFALWAAALLAVGRLVVLAAEEYRPSRLRMALWVLLVLGAGILLFRPHEDVLGGQDQGAYVNTAATFDRLQALTYTDPLLAEVPESSRKEFFYGYRYFPDTKYMCLWVSDVSRATMSPWFQPAYSVLLGVVAHLAPVAWMLYATPFLTLLSAIAMACLTRRLFAHPVSSIAAFVLYVANPIVAWHGRSARAELASGLFLLASAALLLGAWGSNGRRARLDTALAAVCVSIAPFLHVTAWLAAVPIALIVALRIITTGLNLFHYLLIAFVGAVGFMIHTATVTDCYYLGRFLNPLSPAGITLILIGALALIVVYRLGRPASARPATAVLALPDFTSIRFRWVYPVLLVGLSATLIALSYSGILTVSAAWAADKVLRNVLFTEWSPFVMAMSPPVAILAALGWIVFLLRGGPTHARRLVTALALLPGLLLMGQMPILMYFLRRCLPFMIPATVLSLTALITLIPAVTRAHWGRIFSALTLVAIVAAGAHDRSLLYKTTDYRGLLRFLAPFARLVTNENGILLCEYSRYAAPMEHLYGIPTLGLDSDRHMHYERPLDAWANIMRGHPDRPAFFMTPYGRPVDSRFTFEPIRSDSFVTRFLETEPRRLPDAIRSDPIRLTLYRVRLRDPGVESPFVSFPYVRTIDPGNVGLRRFSYGRTRLWRISGIQFQPGETESFDIQDDLLDVDARELLLFFLCEPDSPRPPTVMLNRGVHPAIVEWIPLADNWWVWRAGLHPRRMPRRIRITAHDSMQLSSANAITDENSVTIPPGQIRYRRRYMPLYSRWARSRAEIAVPVPPGGEGLVLVFVNASRTDPNDRPEFMVHAGSETPCHYHKLESRWIWQACPLTSSEQPDSVKWVRLLTVPPWNSGNDGLPENLGVLVRHVVVLPPLGAHANTRNPDDG